MIPQWGNVHILTVAQWRLCLVKSCKRAVCITLKMCHSQKNWHAGFWFCPPSIYPLWLKQEKFNRASVSQNLAEIGVAMIDFCSKHMHSIPSSGSPLPTAPWVCRESWKYHSMCCGHGTITASFSSIKTELSVLVKKLGVNMTINVTITEITTVEKWIMKKNWIADNATQKHAEIIFCTSVLRCLEAFFCPQRSTQMQCFLLSKSLYWPSFKPYKPQHPSFDNEKIFCRPADL